MNIIQLTSEKKLDFIYYCMKYRNEFDCTFLADEDLMSFEPDEDNPTYILLDNSDNIIGVASLILNSYYRSAGSGRFRMFHTIESNKEAYETMLNLILKHTDGLQKVFLFIDDNDKKMAEILSSLNFKIKRYSYTLIKDDLEEMEVSFSNGYELREFVAGRDEVDWCKVRNLGFSKLAGCDAPKTPDMFNDMENDEGHLPGGIMMLYHDNMAIGEIRATKEVEDDEEYVFISSLCLIPKYQGKGLGRKLLKAALNFGKSKGIQKGMLTVNAENENAVSLYLKEGFKKAIVVTCYEYYLNSK